MWEPLWPLFKSGVLKLPSSAVALWGAWPLFRHVTVSPTSTVTVPGENKKSWIVTLVEEALWAPPRRAETVVVVGGAGVSDSVWGPA